MWAERRRSLHDSPNTSDGRVRLAWMKKAKKTAVSSSWPGRACLVSKMPSLRCFLTLPQ